jgi:hypothetical protein
VRWAPGRWRDSKLAELEGKGNSIVVDFKMWYPRKFGGSELQEVAQVERKVNSIMVGGCRKVGPKGLWRILG